MVSVSLEVKLMRQNGGWQPVFFLIAVERSPTTTSVPVRYAVREHVQVTGVNGGSPRETDCRSHNGIR